MKRLLYFSLAALAVLAVSCKKDEGGKSAKIPVPEAIDIGTVVNGKTVKWASFNLGASKPYNYGDYYAWGETKTKTDYTWGTYKYATGYSNKLTKYCPKNQSAYWDAEAKPKGPDGDVSLFPTDDAAHVLLGGKWRMPTTDDYNALLALKDNPDYNWEINTFATDDNGDEAKDFKGNVIRGIRITRKSTGATLFFPAADECDGTDVAPEAGLWGLYWTSGIFAASPFNGYYFSFTSSSVYSAPQTASRAYGFPIRAVYIE